MMTALERLAQAAGRTVTRTSAESAATTAAGISVNAAAASEVNLDFLVTVTVSVVQVTG